MAKSQTLVVLPTYNEIDSLKHSLNGLLKAQPIVDVLIVDDSSPDGTGALADALAKADSRVQVLHRAKKEGLGPAYLAGFSLAQKQGYKFVVQMDADGSHRPEDLGALLAAAEDADLAIGSRWVAGGAVENWPWHRQAISRIGNTYARSLLGSKIRDMTAGFRVYRSTLLREIVDEKVSAHGYAFQVELAWRAEKCGARVIEVPIRFVERAHGNSKMSSAIVREALWLITTWGFRRLFSKN